MKAVLIIAGIVCILTAFVLCLIVVTMFQHPGGIGAEKIVGPLSELVALGFFLAGAVSPYAATRLARK